MLPGRRGEGKHHQPPVLQEPSSPEMDHGASQHPAAHDMAAGRTPCPPRAEGAQRQRMEQTWHLLRTWPPRLQPTPRQWAWGTGVLKNGQGFGVSISSTDGAACPVRKSRHLVSLLLEFPDGSAHGNMCAQAGHTVCPGYTAAAAGCPQRHSVALLPAALASELVVQLRHAQPALLGFRASPSSLPRPPNGMCLPFLFPPRGCNLPQVRGHRATGSHPVVICT